MVDFEVVKLYYNDMYTPYTLEPKTEESTVVYAIKVDGLYFLLGGERESLFICDID